VTEQKALEKARACFLEEGYGCAETTLVVLHQVYGLNDATDSSSAMALNGGVCGSILGAAMSVGKLAAQRISDRRMAKQVARRIVARCLEDFRAQFGAINCRDLVQRDIYTEEQHTAFVESGIWRDSCMQQVEFTIRRLYRLHDIQGWQQVIASLGSE
jgi:hypothetical protein